MTKQQAWICVEGWYRFHHNIGTEPVGPHGFDRGDPDNQVQICSDVSAAEIVDQVLREIGQGVYAPRDLIRLLEHHWKLGSVEGFTLFGPNHGLPPEVIGLGFRTNDLIEVALRRFIRRMCEKQVPKFVEIAS